MQLPKYCYSAEALWWWLHSPAQEGGRCAHIPHKAFHEQELSCNSGQGLWKTKGKLLEITMTKKFWFNLLQHAHNNIKLIWLIFISFSKSNSVTNHRTPLENIAGLKANFIIGSLIFSQLIFSAKYLTD